MAIRTLVDLKVFRILSEKDSTSAKELAERTGADELLLTRLLRVLVAVGYVSEKGASVYAPTKWTRHFSDRLTEGMIKFIYDHTMPCLSAAPTWLKAKGYPNPIDPNESLWHAGHDNCKEPLFEWYGSTFPSLFIQHPHLHFWAPASPICQARPWPLPMAAFLRSFFIFFPYLDRFRPPK
jgi:hypothetical protein